MVQSLNVRQIAARRSGLMQSGLPVFYRFKDLVAAGLVNNRTTLLRLIDKQGFPPGTLYTIEPEIDAVNKFPPRQQLIDPRDLAINRSFENTLHLGSRSLVEPADRRVEIVPR